MDKFPITQNLSRLWSSIIVDELAKNDVFAFYAAPGMRNAPILAAAHYHSSVQTYSFFDERALSYRALGRSKVSKSIPLLTCTSGTAMANFLPAVIEAYKSALPLVILTADRPKELVKTDSNQTIDQTNILEAYCCDTLYLDAPSEALGAQRLRSLISSTIGRAKIHRRPVHINLPLREPLDSTSAQISKQYLEDTLKSFADSMPKIISTAHQQYVAEYELQEELAKSKNVLLVVGKLDGKKSLSSYIDTLKKIDIPKYFDITSGLKYHFSLEDKLVPNFDHPEVLAAYKKGPPEVIIHIGGRLVSKHYYNFIEQSNAKIIHVTNVDFDHDPGFSNSNRIICSPLSFLQTLENQKLSIDSPINWFEFVERKREIIEDGSLTSAYISKNTIETLDIDYDLLIGNSTAIRSFDNFVSPDSTSKARVFSNRGVSGIEGFIATLTGLSDENDKPKLLIIGDISFKYDLNSLYQLNHTQADKNLTIVIVNNKRGDIFNLLPIAKEKEFLHLLTTPHDDEFERILSAFSNISYKKVKTKSMYIESLKSSMAIKGVNIIEAIIDNESNMDVFGKLRTVKL